MLNQKQGKIRAKQHPTVRPNLKSDASNQTKVGQPQQGVHTVATSAGNK